MNRNYQKELDKVIEGLKKEGRVPTLLLHGCCAPCSSYVLEYLSAYFSITLYFYNPNISSEEEYEKRLKELHRLVDELPAKHPITIIDGEYNQREYFSAIKGLEHIPEGGERCFACYRLRLENTAKLAKEKGFDYFTTTLSISPLKNAPKLNSIGEELEQLYETAYLYSDFKKKNGYKRSIELSCTYDLYRQDYCGCIFSRRERELKKEEKQGLQ